MASISNVRLQIVETSGSANILVSYRLDATNGDGANGQAYRELVQLVGVDIGPGEDGRSELISGGTLWDGVVKFSTSQVRFDQSRETPFINSSILDEDGGLFIKEDEIQALVTLIPLPPESPSAVSNIVRRGGPAGNHP